MNKQEILIQLPTEPSYWGSTATPDDVDRIIDGLRDMILMEFGERFDLSVTRMAQPEGSGVHCIHDGSAQVHDGSAQEVWEWIGNNWTAAL